MKKLIFSFLLGLCSIIVVAQPKSATQILSFEDYLSYVDAFHPVARQAFILKENAAGLGTGFLNFLSLERGQLIFKRSFLVPAKMGFKKRNSMLE